MKKACNTSKHTESRKKEKIIEDHDDEDERTNYVKSIDSYLNNSSIMMADSIVSESDTFSRARKMVINENRRKRRLLTKPRQGDLNLALSVNWDTYNDCLD